MALYDLKFPYHIKFKGFTYRVNRVTGPAGYVTTIEKETAPGSGVYGPAVTFTLDVDKTPAYVDIPMGQGSTGAIGTPNAQSSGIDVDANPSFFLMLQEGESQWGKQLLQNILHLAELVDSAYDRGYLLDNPEYWMAL